MIDYRPNRCYFEMMSLYKEHHRPNNCLTFCNEGGSRSGKTYDAFDMIIDFCLLATSSLIVYVFRDTLVNCKDFTLTDFKDKMRLRGLYDSASMTGESQRPEYKLKDSIIRFRGLDKMDEKEGFPSDIVFINEALSGVSKEQYESVVMRCRLFNILDWNPRFTRHWAFDLEGLPNVFFTHTTFRDNVHAPQSVVNRILSYEPTPDNIAAGTADPYRWNVYGLGVRAAQEGLIFPNIDWIDEFPDDLEHVILGMDFGFTNDPTAILRGGMRGKDLYIEELFYTPVADPEILYELTAPIINQYPYCYCDTIDKYAKNPDGMVEYLASKGLPVVKAKKYPGCVENRINYLKSCRIHAVRTKNMEIEANSYVWATYNGLPLNTPADAFNHLWDCAGYMMDSEFRYTLVA